MPDLRPSIENILPPEADPDLRFMLDYWHEKRGDRLFPARTDVDPLDFARLLPLIYIVEGGTLDEMKVRLAGTAYRDLYGFEISGKRILDLIPAQEGQDVHRDYRLCLQDKLPVFRKYDMHWRPRDSELKYQRLLMPLGTADGVVSHILAFARFFTLDGEALFVAARDEDDWD